MKKITETVTSTFKTLLALVLIGLVLISCANIFLRYVLEINWLAADELQVFIMIGLAFLGAIVVSVEQGQLRLDLLGQIDAPWLKSLLGVLESVVTVLVCGFVAYHSWAFLVRTYSFGQKGGSSGIAMWIPHSTVTICFAALTLLALARLAQRLFAVVSSLKGAK
ncbi:TRAP transporter small permease [Oceaniglobus ichthyenteri]|uniref:TRAP transporter small permease n=1 Tax=Oceaniglobus ichthyenteri TaxID=2136177 RepID=UPI0013DDAE0D|nr:TRAP transporter small permease subunit [Oceaniglobus ichthyenteri]